MIWSSGCTGTSRCSPFVFLALLVGSDEAYAYLADGFWYDRDVAL